MATGDSGLNTSHRPAGQARRASRTVVAMLFPPAKNSAEAERAKARALMEMR